MLVNIVREKITSLYLVCTVGCDDFCGTWNRRRDENGNDIPMCKRSCIVTICLYTRRNSKTAIFLSPNLTA